MNKLTLKILLPILVLTTAFGCVKKEDSDDQKLALLLFALYGAQNRTCTIENLGGSTITFSSILALVVQQNIQFTNAGGVLYGGVEAPNLAVAQRVEFKNTGATVSAYDSQTCRNVVGVTSSATGKLSESSSGSNRTFTVLPGGAGNYFFIVTVPSVVSVTTMTAGIE